MWSRLDWCGIRLIKLCLYYFVIISIFHCTGEVPVIATLGAVVALLCLIVFGTLSALLVIVHKYYKKGTQLLNSL